MRRALVWLLLASPLILTSCKGFWTAPASSSGSGSTTDSSGNFYVLNVEKNQVAGYYVNAGVLTALTGSPYTVPTTPLAIAIAPDGNFLYVSTADGIYDYSIASTGELTLGNSSGPISSDQAISMQVSPDSSWLLEIASGAPYVYAIPINSSTGVATSKAEQYVVLPASSVQQVTIAADETFVFVAMGSDGTATIPFNSANTNPLGAVSRIGVLNSAGAAISVAVDPVVSGQTAPRLFYIGETAGISGSNSGALRAFDFSTLTEISGSPFASQGLAPYSILPLSSGDYVYVVNRQVSGSSTGVIGGFTVGSTSTAYNLTALGSTFTVGTNPVALAEDSTGKFVFAVDFGGSPDLEGYTFDSTNAGYLDGAISAATGIDPVEASGIAAAP
jgi:6-phosphogluconolactonase (cycloisomerase 2 family)